LIGAICGCALTLLGLSFGDRKIYPGIALLCPPVNPNRPGYDVYTKTCSPGERGP
jgi:hypothetical protein